jgi:hypothetical protein
MPFDMRRRVGISTKDVMTVGSMPFNEKRKGMWAMNKVTDLSSNRLRPHICMPDGKNTPL